MADRPGGRTALRWGLKPGSYQVTARPVGPSTAVADRTDRSEARHGASHKGSQAQAAIAARIIAVTKRHWREKRQQAYLASGAEADYLAPMARRYACTLVFAALASCTSSARLSPSDEATVQYARYYFIEPTDTGVFEVWARPATVCYSTQSYPARPIDLIARANGASNRVASYEPPRTEYCDRAVDDEVVSALLSDPTSFVIRWSPQTGEPVVMTPLTPTSST